MINLLVKNRIAEVCKQKNMTLRELSQITGISEDTMYRIQGANLRLENVARIMTALNASFDDLFTIIVLGK